VPDRCGIEVVYALPERQVVVPLQVDAATTLRQAIEQSGLLRQFPDIDLRRGGIGVFGQARGLDEVVRDGDRIEIYRPLVNDPKDLRRRRAKR
jgi:uncharacterized protein